ncbi:hypothetical protein AB0331_15365 [Dietzia maris]|uniref:hypothetical protein n=1 Tax=Dietzia maris TaxID=37915 RepID=UPI00344B60DA
MNATSNKARIVAIVLLAAFAVSALVSIIGVALSAWRGDGDQSELAERADPDRRSLIETTALSAEAQPYLQDLEQAAEQCPTVLTAQRLDRYISHMTGWNHDHDPPVVVTVSVAGMTENQWEASGGGNPNDVPTAIRNVATLWCAHSTTLAGEDIDLEYDLPAPVDADDDQHAAALGLAAILIGVDNVRSGQASISDHPDVEQAIKAVL